MEVLYYIGIILTLVALEQIVWYAIHKKWGRVLAYIILFVALGQLFILTGSVVV